MKFLSAIIAGLERVLRINRKQKLKSEFQNFVPDPNRDPLPENCPTNVDPELCYAICNQMLCWAYPVKAHFRRRRAVAQSFNEKLELSRRGADFTQEHLDCYWSKPVNQCNKLYDNDFDPLN